MSAPASQWLLLDHLFYRGLSVTQAEAVASDGSDHNPLRVEVLTIPEA